jgi:hypothetical protein
MAFGGMLAHVGAMKRGIDAFNPFGEPAFLQWRYTLPDGTIVRGIDRIAFQNCRPQLPDCAQ